MMAGGGEDHDRAPAAMGAILVRGFVIAIRRGSLSSVSFCAELVESCS